MPINSSPANPVSSISKKEALDHWTNGMGTGVYVDMSSHMTTGGGSIFSISDFASEIEKKTQNLSVATCIYNPFDLQTSRF